MTKDEALRMAIEIMERLHQPNGDSVQLAIQACKEALADYKDGNCCTEGCIKCDARKILAETKGNDINYCPDHDGFSSHIVPALRDWNT